MPTEEREKKMAAETLDERQALLPCSCSPHNILDSPSTHVVNEFKCDVRVQVCVSVGREN